MKKTIKWKVDVSVLEMTTGGGRGTTHYLFFAEHDVAVAVQGILVGAMEHPNRNDPDERYLKVSDDFTELSIDGNQVKSVSLTDVVARDEWAEDYDADRNRKWAALNADLIAVAVKAAVAEIRHGTEAGS